MKVTQATWSAGAGWSGSLNGSVTAPQLVFLFGGTNVLKQGTAWAEIKSSWPEAHLMGCSTAGEICGTRITDDSLVATAVEFESTSVRVERVALCPKIDSFHCGVELGRKLEPEGLVHVFVLSDGLSINGSELVKGLTQELPEHVTVTGGLAGDGDRFQETFVLSNDRVESGTVLALGLYGERLDVGYASLGGWDSFGPERLVTRSEGNVLYELDGQSALQLYKTYLGDHADGLPATGLLFPLAIRQRDDTPVVRTVLAVDEQAQSMTFAGDVPEGAYARLMRANFDRLVEGAAGAARNSVPRGSTPDLAILISCVGRKMVLKQRVEEEVEAVREVLGDRPLLTGFYSYGEISPFTSDVRSELHNQTMTITVFSEQ